MTFVAGIALLLFGAILAFWMKPDEELTDPADCERTTNPARAPAPAPGGGVNITVASTRRPNARRL